MIRTGEVAAAVEAAINENYLQDHRGYDRRLYGQPAAGEGHRYTLSAGRGDALRCGARRVSPCHGAGASKWHTDSISRRRVAPCCMKFAGIADRIDALDDGTLRVVDYKTGAPHLEFAGVESLFRGEGKQRLSNILQTLALRHDALPYAGRRRRTRALLRAGDEPSRLSADARRPGNGRPRRHVTRFMPNGSRSWCAQTLAELYDPSVPFRQCEDADTCNFCDFNVICKR